MKMATAHERNNTQSNADISPSAPEGTKLRQLQFNSRSRDVLPTLSPYVDMSADQIRTSGSTNSLSAYDQRMQTV